jgi:hypothetical protein
MLNRKEIECYYNYSEVLIFPPPSINVITEVYPIMKESPDCHLAREQALLHQISKTSPLSSLIEQKVTIDTSDTALFHEVTELIRASQQSVDDVGKRYFRALALWVPFICPARVQEYFTQPATAEFAVLLLCMALNTYDPPRHCPPPIAHEVLYLHAKTSFARMQVLRGPALATIQAGILISTYEYAHGRPDEALTTINVCARMAYRAKIHKKTECISSNESWNTWWALRIFERTFYCESTLDSLPFITSTPEGSEPLPYQLGETGNRETPSWATQLSPNNLVEVDCLGRAAQASRLLDQVFHTIRQIAPEKSIPHLIFLDGELQRLLSVTMNKCHGERGGHCGAVGISIRALFILHQHIAHLNNMSIGLDWSMHSQAALDTVAQMVIDIARSHRIIHGADVDIISPVCNYVVRHTLTHIYGKRYADSNAWFKDTDTLRQSLDKMNRRWSIKHDVTSAC